MKTLTLLLALVFSIGSSVIAPAQNSVVTLVSTGAVWKYLDTGSAPGEYWNDISLFTGFSDSTWLSGPAQLGYGDGDEATVVRAGTNQSVRAIATYFRHTFELSDPSIDYSNLVLRVLRDDGVIVYLNGGEIFRNNMPSGPVNYQTLATATVNAPDENAFLTASVPAGYLLYGPNVLAAEIHQVNTASTDISFDAELTAMAGPIGPPQPIVVTARAAADFAYERGTAGSALSSYFVISSSSALSHPFTVYFTLGGTASNGVDYSFRTNEVVISAGGTNAYVGINPIQDNLVEGTETVTLQLISPPCAAISPPPPDCYSVGSQNGGTIYIVDAPPGNSPPSVHINTPTNGSSFIAPAGIIIGASANDSNGAVASVEFFQNGQLLGVRSNISANPFSPSIFWSNVPAGSYTLTARARDNTGLASTSAPVQITVTASLPGSPRSILVSTGAVWKYLDDGSDQGDAWTAPFFFNDAPWLSGPAQLGYGDGDEATVVRPGTNQNVRAVTTYFRHTFELNDTSVIYSNLVLRVLRDDGVIVYLNGGEILRNNMPVGPVNYLTLASAQPVDENEFITVPVPEGYLLYGPNVLAAEIHQASVNSADISFDAELTAAGPDSQRPAVTVHVTDSWGREPGVPGVVEYAQFALWRTGPTTNALTVSVILSGTAGNGVDYAFVSNRVTIPVGATQALVNIAPLIDNAVEPTETVQLTVVPPACADLVPPPPGCYLVGSPASGSVSILDAPIPTNPPPSITLQAPTNGSVFTAGANIAITVGVGNSDGTVARVDFLANGQVIGTYPDPPNYNTISFHWLNVSNGAYAIAARAWDEQGASTLSATANILVLAPTNPPPLPPGEILIGFNPASLPFGSKVITNWTEGGFFFSTPDRMAHTDGGLSNRPDDGTAHLSFSANQKPLTFHNIAGNLFSLLSMDLAEYSTVFPTPKNITVTGYKADNSSVSVVLRIDGVIDGPGGVADFETFTFGPEFSQLDRVEVFPDIYALDNVRVSVGNPPTNSVPPRTVVNVLAVDPVAGEPPHAAGSGKFSIRRSGDLAASLEVLFTIGGSASNGIDYATISNQVTIPAGAAETFIDIVPLADSLVELNEQVVLTLQTPVCIALFPPPPECYVLGVSTSAVVNIISAPPTNSPLPVVTLFSPLNGSTFAPGSTILLGATTSGTSAAQRVEFYRSGILIGAKYGPVNSGADWTFLWTNPPSGSHTLRAIAIDAIDARGTSAPVSIVVGSNSVPPTTPLVYLYASDAAAAETGALTPPNPGRFTFMRYGPTNGALQVCFEISGTASNSLDYLIATNCVIIPPGASNAFVDVEPIDDAVAEPTEVVVLRLLSSAGYQIGQPSSATVLIADNDSLSNTNQPPFPRLTVLPQGSDEMATNGCRLILQGDGPVTCVIECSIDMLNWTPICTNTLSGAAISIVDAEANSPRRFYRLVTQ